MRRIANQHSANSLLMTSMTIKVRRNSKIFFPRCSMERESRFQYLSLMMSCTPVKPVDVIIGSDGGR